MNKLGQSGSVLYHVKMAQRFARGSSYKLQEQEFGKSSYSKLALVDEKLVIEETTKQTWISLTHTCVVFVKQFHN